MHVADDDHEIGALGREGGGERRQHARDGLRSWRRFQLQPQVGRADSQLLEDRLVHLEIVVLAGVDEAHRKLGTRAQGAQDRRDLDEVRPRADDAVDRKLPDVSQ